MHPRQRDRLRHVDPDEAGVRVRAAEGVPPEHPVGVQVAREGELAGRLRNAVGAAHGRADPAELEPRGAHDAALRTASKTAA